MKVQMGLTLGQALAATKLALIEIEKASRSAPHVDPELLAVAQTKYNETNKGRAQTIHFLITEYGVRLMEAAEIVRQLK